MVFPVVMYWCESRTVKKAEHRKIDAFELWYCRRHLEVPWTARRSNQNILKEISPEYSLEGLMLKLKLQYFGQPMPRTDSISHEVIGPDAMILVFWMLSFKPTFSLSSFTFIKRLFHSSSLSAVRVVSSAYLRLLIFLLAILILACASSSPAFLMM